MTIKQNSKLLKQNFHCMPSMFKSIKIKNVMKINKILEDERAKNLV